MSKKVLIVNNGNQIGGSEKLSLEICKFAKSNSLKPIIFVPNKLEKEPYDEIYKANDIKVVKGRISFFKAVKDVLKFQTINTLYWYFILRFFLNIKFKTVHIINLSELMHYRTKKVFKHKKRFLWHVENNIQSKNQKYWYDENIFTNINDTLVYIFANQREEIHNQYGNIACKEIQFKLFLTNRL
jgi:hypothetical protein